MNDILYILIIILLTIMIIFYGGHNNRELIEYDSNFFLNFNNILIYEKKLQIYNHNFIDEDYIDISTYIPLSETLIPNLIKPYFIYIKPYSYFNINKLIKELNKKSLIMIIFNHNNNNNLELLLNIENNIAFNYKINKKISINAIYNIYNNSDTIINLTLFILKKPYWYY